MKNKFMIVKSLVTLLLILCANGLFTAPCGDVDSNGSVDIVDALLIAQVYVNAEVQDIDKVAADVNADGQVNIVDALLIAQYYVGQIDT